MSNRVSVTVGYTRNMGNFESLRYDVGLESDPMSGESTAQAYERVAEFVKKRLMEQIREVEQEVKEIRGT